MKPVLFIDEFLGGRYRIGWDCHDGDAGAGYLGMDRKDGLGPCPTDSEDWEQWAPSKAMRDAGVPFEMESLTEARFALRIAKAALKGERPMPTWAIEALNAGWKPPKKG